MGNSITNRGHPSESIEMSNGLTCVFLDVICLAGADVAKNDYEKDLMIWFGQRDQDFFGLGNVSFDVEEIIWEKDIFEKQKSFLFHVVERASQKINWEKLGYDPHEYIFEVLAKFKQMIGAFKEDDIDPGKQGEIFQFDQHVRQYEQCKKHRIFKHYKGCIVCNNEPI